LNHVTTILFDLDGTLVDSIPGLVASFEHIAAKYPEFSGVDRDIVRRHIGRPFSELMLQMTGCADRAARLLEEFRQHNRTIIPALPLFPGCSALLGGLQQRGLTLGLVTSKSRASTLLTLSSRQLTHFFAVIVAKEDCEFHKPRPEPIMQAMRALAVDARTVAYVGDTIYDVQAAKAAQCTSVAALWGAHDPDAVMDAIPDRHFCSPEDLLAAFPATV
jgi:pyrophosphatase PpaX